MHVVFSDVKPVSNLDMYLLCACVATCANALIVVLGHGYWNIGCLA